MLAEVGDVGEISVRHLDTSDLASVRTFATDVLETEKAIHVLVGAVVVVSGGEQV